MNKGNLSVEAVVIVAIFGLLTSTVVALSQRLMDKQKMLALAQLGTDLISYPAISERQRMWEMNDAIKKMSFRDKEHLQWTMRRFLDIKSARFYKLYAAELSMGNMYEKSIIHQDTVGSSF